VDGLYELHRREEEHYQPKSIKTSFLTAVSGVVGGGRAEGVALMAPEGGESFQIARAITFPPGVRGGTGMNKLLGRGAGGPNF